MVILSDVTTRRESETLTKIQLAALESSPHGIFITDGAGTITWVNEAFAGMTGYDKNVLLKMTADEVHGDGPTFSTSITPYLDQAQTWQDRVTACRRDGDRYTAEQTTTPISDSVGRWRHFVSVREDISARLREDGLVRLSKYDPLTGLPNRHHFMEHLRSAVVRANRSGTAVAAMVLDIYNFKAINNTLGHAAGDSLIASAAARIFQLMRTTDTFARLGGDDFGIPLENVTDMAAASRTVRQILDCFRKPFEVDGNLHKITASMGIAAYPKDEADPAVLLRGAELAMYQAKSHGGISFKYFDRERDEAIRYRAKVEADLQRALDNQELWLAYQPQMDLLSCRIIGAEALIR